MDKMERIGSGIRRMRDLVKTAGLKDLVFESDTFFRVIFYRGPQFSLKGSQTSSQSGSQTSSQRIVLMMKENSAITIEELAKGLGISSRAIKKHIKILREQGFIKRIGHDFGGHWEVKKKMQKSKLQ